MQKIKIGMAGCGLIGKYHYVPGIRKSQYAELIGVVASKEANARKFAQEMNIPKWYSDYKSMLKDPDIDAVIIGTPNYLHYQQVISAAKANKHILCEKPMTTDMKKAYQMVEVCEKFGVKFMVAHHLRYKVCNQKVKQILENNKLGKISTVRIQWSFNLKNWKKDKSWRINKKLSGGGQVMNVNSHCVDLLIYFFGPVKKVSAFMREDMYKEVEDVSMIMIEFKNGILAVAQGSYSEEGTKNNLEIFGNKSSLIVENACSVDNNGLLRKIPDNKVYKFKTDISPYTTEIDHFSLAVCKGFHLISSGRNALETMRVLMSAYKSAKKGEHIFHMC